MEKSFRSGCPIASTLDIVGDKWSLLVIRDMLLHHKTTFKEFVGSDERIAPGILSARLKSLAHYGLISKQKRKSNQKENLYLLTEKGMELASILIDFSIWGDRHMRNFNEIKYIEGLHLEKEFIIDTVKQRYHSFIQELAVWYLN